MPSSSAAAASRAAEPTEPPYLALPPLPLLQQRLPGLGLRDRGLLARGSGGVGVAQWRAGLAPLPDLPGEPRPGGAGETAAGDEGDLELEEDEEDHLASLLLLSSSSSSSQPLPLLLALDSVLLSPAFDSQEAPGGLHDPQGMMAAMMSHAYDGGSAVSFSGEQRALLRRKSVNTTECVPVPSSEHVAEIVGRQGCKIKALRAKTNTYIKTPVRGEEPIFVVTGRKEDVAMAKREILSAVEHFSMIRASCNKNGPALGGLPHTPNLPGQMTVQVRVPYHVVGLVVGPKGATIKRIQQQTHTYIVTPSRDMEPVFEVTGMPENVDHACEEIEIHIAMRTRSYIKLNEESDFHYNGTDVKFEGGILSSAWLASNPVPLSHTRMISMNDSSSSLGSGSTDSYFGSNRLADFSPTSPFSTGNFWFGETLPSVSTEDLAVDSPVYDSLPTPSQTLWTPFEPVNPLSGFGSDSVSNAKPQRQGSQPSTPCLSPTFPESLDYPLSRRARSDPPSAGHQAGLPIYIPAFSNGTNSYSSSNGGSTSSSPPESRQKHDCVICFDSEVIAALVPCGHNLFCLECANKICEKETPLCPVCQTAVTQSIQIHS
ncbi:MEX3C ligase, partial [Tachuris rubrigastra]|nr:MEX3C ligase [Tachuris rubrigastra]